MQGGDAEKIYELMQRFRKININHMKAGGMPHREMMMLKAIKLNAAADEGITISGLSELFGISKPAVSQMVNTLDDKGYVERVTTKTDRRLVFVRLTARGEECLFRRSRAHLQVLSAIFDRMGAADTRCLLRLLEKLYAIVSDRKHS